MEEKSKEAADYKESLTKIENENKDLRLKISELSASIK